ncbi:MAG: hypothetical protein ACREMA_06360 [Longimicrobiales bacterium]
MTKSTGEVDEITLVAILAGRVLASLTGELSPRISRLSDSLAAVKAYLAGRQANDNVAAIAHYDRALAIDSTFGLAAYFRAVAAFQGNSIPLIYDAFRRAWELRNKLSTDDQAQLLALLGPNYPEPSTWTEYVQQAQKAARLNPSAVEAIQRLGGWLILWGPQTDLNDPLPRGIAALDSALALDPTFPALLRLHAALLKRDSSGIRRAAAHYLKNNSTDMAQVLRWIVARSFDDDSALAEMRPRLKQLRNGLWALAAFSMIHGFPLADVDAAITARLTELRAAEDVCGLQHALIAVAAARGQAKRTTTLAAALPSHPECAPDYTVAFLRLIEPGFEAAADSWRPQFVERTEYYAADFWKTDPLNRSTYATMKCYAALRRVARGVTSGVRATIDRMTQLLRDVDPGPGPRAGRLGLCGRVLEAKVESLS